MEQPNTSPKPDNHVYITLCGNTLLELASSYIRANSFRERSQSDLTQDYNDPTPHRKQTTVPLFSRPSGCGYHQILSNWTGSINKSDQLKEDRLTN